MVILISIYIFMPATWVSVVAEAIRETTNQIGMALYEMFTFSESDGEGFTLYQLQLQLRRF